MRRRPILAVAMVLGATLGLGATIRPFRAAEHPSRQAGETGRPPTDDISFYEARVGRDPYGARDRAVLASLYLARARVGNGDHDLIRAEELARQSLQLRERRNSGTTELLVGALMAQHKFTEAYLTMARELASDSTDAVQRATMGEIALELGRYTEADRLFESVALARFRPAIGIRYARWLEINGQSGEARVLFEAIRSELDGAFRVPREQLAWLDLRIGELAARNGRPDLAGAAFSRGLDLAPEDPRLLTAVARLHADRGAWRDAIALGERALAERFDPTTLILLAEACAAVGDTAQAAEYVRGLERAVSGSSGAMHRAWALFLLDHGKSVEGVLLSALADLASRRDVYGYDLGAWALLKAGRPAEARPLADSALSRGTQDAGLYYRAARVALAAGDSAVARSRLARALEINPRFHPVLADTARRLMGRIAAP